jgi:hypothetical protein
MIMMVMMKAAGKGKTQQHEQSSDCFHVSKSLYEERR